MSVEIIHGDNMPALNRLWADGRRFALIYMDPPFMTGQTWRTTHGEPAFEDKWDSIDEYSDAIRAAVEDAFLLLIPQGCLVWDPETQDSKSLRSRRKCSSVGEEESPGVPLSDVWELGIVPRVSHERTGYPTQKPEALLERLILACTNEGDWVLDPFCGSGTALAVAHRLGRNAVGIDSSEVAVRYARGRLAPMLAQGQLFASSNAQESRP